MNFKAHKGASKGKMMKLKSIALIALMALPMVAPPFAAWADDAADLERYRTADKLGQQHLATFDTLDFDVFTGQKWDRLKESHGANVKVHWPDGHVTEGIDAHIADLKYMFSFAPDTRILEHPIKLQDGEWTSVVGFMEGTSSQPMKLADRTEIAPTGKAYRIAMATVSHWAEDGTMDEEYLFWDNQAFMAQVGLGKLPPGGPGAPQTPQIPERTAEMNVTIIGTGNIGSGLASVLASGHAVTVTSREGAPALAAKLGVAHAPLKEAVASAEVVILALPYDAVAGLEADFAGKIVVDATNPVTADFSGLQLGHETSAAEEIAKALKGARVVKAFNTVFAQIYAEGLTIGGVKVQTFVASDDTEAKAAVIALAKDAGFDARDAGGLKNARYIEPLAYLNIQFGYMLGQGTQIAPAWVAR